MIHTVLDIPVAVRPRPPRWECNDAIVVIDDCGRELMGWLGNRSDEGFMAQCEEKLRIGAVVQVILPDDGEVCAQVRWALGWRFGAKILANQSQA